MKDMTKIISPTTKSFKTPWNTTVQADDIVTVLEQYYALPKEDQIREKSAWLELINQILQADSKIIDVQFNPNKDRDVTFIYDNEEQK